MWGPERRSFQTSPRPSKPIKPTAYDHGHSKHPNLGFKRLAAGGLFSFLLSVSLFEVIEQDDALPFEPTPANLAAGDGRDTSKPRFRLSEIQQHDAHSPEPWVTSGDKVYNITDWVAAHPGGKIILLAAGASIDPFWEVFSIHQAAYVREILEQYVIGFIDAADLVDGKAPAATVEGLFKNDPVRDARLITHTSTPRNAETPSEALAESLLTPNELFYVRHHMWVPVVGEGLDGVEEDGDEHTLDIELPSGDVRSYTMAELRSRFRTHTITAVLQCSGNRRSDMSQRVSKTNGLPWSVGAISNAEWEGVRLLDVLQDAGLVTQSPSPASSPSSASEDTDEEPPVDPAGLHVQFSGLEGYGASIPLPTALDPRNDVLLAYRMNGQPLPRDHGFPLRVVVPGHVAARSVKWLQRIVVADEESPSQWQKRDYKCFGPNEGDKPDWDRYPAIQEMPITSAVTAVQVGEEVRKSRERWVCAAREAREAREASGSSGRAPAGVRDAAAWRRAHAEDEAVSGGEPVALAGYAYSGGGKEIVRVDVSVDGGRTWDQAELLDEADGSESESNGIVAKGSKTWSWKRWRYLGTLPQLASDSKTGQAHDGKSNAPSTPPAAACTEIIVKATDDAYNTQPEDHSSIFNIRGNLATAWHRLRVCPTCTAVDDGRLVMKWTADGVYGCGFRGGDKGI